MHVLTLATIAALITTPPPATENDVIAPNDAVVAFVEDPVQTFPAATAISGEQIAACRFVLPTQVQEESPYLRVRIAGPDTDVWVSTSSIVRASEVGDGSLDDVLYEKHQLAMATREAELLAAAAGEAGHSSVADAVRLDTRTLDAPADNTLSRAPQPDVTGADACP